jgi:hypothetical protein
MRRTRKRRVSVYLETRIERMRTQAFSAARQAGGEKRSKHCQMHAQVNDGPTKRTPLLRRLPVDRRAHADKGAVAGEEVPERKGQRDEARGTVDGAAEEDDTDEVGEEQKTALGLEDEGGGGGERRELGAWAEDEANGGRGLDGGVDGERELGGGKHGCGGGRPGGDARQRREDWRCVKMEVGNSQPLRRSAGGPDP